jgi:hypothetical protein
MYAHVVPLASLAHEFGAVTHNETMAAFVGGVATAGIALLLWSRDQHTSRGKDAQQREGAVVADFAASVSVAADALDALERRIVLTLREEADADGDGMSRYAGSLDDLLETTIANARRAVTELSSHYARIAFAFHRHSEVHMVDGGEGRVRLPDGYEPTATDFAKLCADLCRSSVELAVLDVRRGQLDHALDVLRLGIDFPALRTPDGIEWAACRRVGAGRIAIRLRDLIVSLVIARHSHDLLEAPAEPALRTVCELTAAHAFALRGRYDVELRGAA